MSLPISFRQIEYALAVQKHGSFSAAARASFVSQPSLSEAIQKLEETLGAQIFDRSKSPLQITELGEELLKQCQKVVSETEHLIESANAFHGKVQGNLRVGLIPTVAPALIPMFLKSYRNKYPLVKVEIKELPTETLLKALEGGDLDAAILSTPATAPGHLIEKPLYYEAFMIYASKENTLLNSDIIKFPDLEDQNLILMDESHCMRDQILSICERKKDPTTKTTVHGGIHTLLSVVDQENGFTLIPELLTGIANKDQLRMIKASNFRRKISLLTNKSYSKKRMVELLAQEILNNLPKNIPTKLGQKIELVDPDRSRF